MSTLTRRRSISSLLIAGLVVAFAALLLPAALSAAQMQWPQFRGPSGQGVSQAAKLPVEWSTTKNVAWKVEVGGHGWSSPVVADGKIYLTTAKGDAKSGTMTLHAIALDAATGDKLFDTEIFKPDKSAAGAMHQKNSPASATPIVTADRLYVHFGHMGTAALDLTGKILWKQTDIKYPPVHGNGGSPILVQDMLVFNCDGARDPFVVALDAGSGAVRWKTPRRDVGAKKTFSFSTPLAITLDGKTQIISPGSGHVAAYAPGDGRELWHVKYGQGYSVVPRPVFSHDLLFVSSSFDSAQLYAIRPAGAQGDATEKHIAWTQRKGAPHSASMVVLGDEIYYVSDGGVATCADALTGEVHWTQRLGGGFSASLLAGDGRIYFQNEVGVGYVIKAGKTYELLATNDLGEPTLASYAATDGALYIRTKSKLYKIAP